MARNYYCQGCIHIIRSVVENLAIFKKEMAVADGGDEDLVVMDDFIYSEPED